MTHADQRHRAMDRGYDRALAHEDDERDDGRPLARSRDRGRDARSLSSPPGKVLLMQLSVRTSARGKPYLSGFLGKASVVAFAGEVDKFGNETWDLYLSTPTPRPDGQRQAAGGGRDGDRG